MESEWGNDSFEGEPLCSESFAVLLNQKNVTANIGALHRSRNNDRRIFLALIGNAFKTTMKIAQNERPIPYSWSESAQPNRRPAGLPFQIGRCKTRPNY